MYYKRITLIILVSFCCNISAISQDKQNPIIKEQIKTSSILDVDFDSLNSFNIENLEIQAYILFLKNYF